MGSIQIKRGLSTNLPTSAPIGEILYTSDTKKFYIGNGDGATLTEFSNYAQILELLNQKAALAHTHTSSEVTDFNDAVDGRITLQKGAANGLATLDANGLIPTSQIPSVFKEAEVVKTIAERNALTAFAGLHAFVLDATTDSTVESGGAEYIFDGTSWVKIIELKDLDTIISWENIVNRPNIISNFIDLNDVTSTYENNEGKFLTVNSDGTGIEFSSVYTGDIDGGEF